MKHSRLKPHGLALALAVGAAVLLQIPVTLWLRQIDEEIAEKRNTLGKLSAVLTKSPALSSLDADSVAAARDDFLKGDQDGLILAELQTRLRAIIIGHRCELTSASTSPSKMQDGLAVLGLKLQIRGEMANVHQVILAIEASRPLLFVERADLRLEQARGAVAEGAQTQMIVDLIVTGAKWPLDAAGVLISDWVGK